jgi:hypothetical protein
MDKETIQQIATEIVAHLPFGARYSVVYAVVTVLIAGLGVWFGSFLKTKGQNFATKQDFHELQKQLKANTELIETIKSEVSQRDWAQREWTTLRRIKLEALLEKVHECEVYLEQRRHSATEGKIASPERDPVDELYALATLYFPELENKVGRFAILCREQNMLVSDLAQAVSAAHSSQDATAHKVALENFRAGWADRYPKFLDARRQLVDAAPSLLKTIMNVDEHPSDER